MSRFDAPFEIHVHGQIPIRPDVDAQQVSEVLKPLWKYAGAASFEAGAQSAYEEEPGLVFDAHDHVLQLCWTVPGDAGFRHIMEEICMGLNELSSAGAAVEVTFYDAEFEDEDPQEGLQSQDDFVMLFVGPNPAAIMQVQRDLLVQDLIGLMERHFDASELNGLISEVDQLFAQRFEALSSSLDLGKPPRGLGGGSHGSNRKPRHLH